MNFLVPFVLLYFFPSFLLSLPMQSIFIDSLSHFSNQTDGSFENPFQNLSQAFENVSSIPFQLEEFAVSIFLKSQATKEDSVYVVTSFFSLDMKNFLQILICSYDSQVVTPPNQCNFTKNPNSAYLLFLTEKDYNYTQEFLAILQNGTVSLVNLNVNLAFENSKIQVILLVYQVDFFIYNCSLNVANINGDLANHNNKHLVFLSLQNSDLFVNYSLVFNSKLSNNNLGSPFYSVKNYMDDPFQLVLFSFKFLQLDIITFDFFKIILDSCQVNVINSEDIIRYIRILEVDGQDKVSVVFTNSHFVDSPARKPSMLGSLCSTNDQLYLFAIKIISAKTVTLSNNLLEAYEFNKNCKYKSFRLEIMDTQTLSLFNETYYNIIIYMVFSSVQEAFLSKMTITTNGTETEQRNYNDDNYLLMYISDYDFFMMDTFLVYNYAISKSILFQFQPSEFGNYTLIENVILEKTSGTIYFLFEPNIYVKPFDYDKAIDIMFCNFSEMFNGGLVFAGLISTSITHITVVNCLFENITNNDFKMHMKSIYYLPVPLIFFDSLTSKDINLQNIIFRKIDNFIGDFINVILDTSPGTLKLEKIEFYEINSKDIITFVFVQAPPFSQTDIYVYDFMFQNCTIKNNLLTIRSLDSENIKLTVSPLVILKNVLFHNITQSNVEYTNINDWDMNIYFALYIYYPKIWLIKVKISDSILSYRDHNIVLSGSKSIHLNECIIENINIQYQRSPKTVSTGHFIHIMPFVWSYLSVHISDIYFKNISFQPQSSLDIMSHPYQCSALQFFIFVFSLKNATIVVERSIFKDIIGNCQMLTIFSFSEEFIGEKMANIKSKVLVKDSVFMRNEGFIGSVLYCDEGRVVFKNNKFLYQKAKIGAVAYCGYLCNLTINSSLFIHNRAEYGDVLALDTIYENFQSNNSKILLHNNSFYDNYWNLSNKNSSSGLFYFINMYSFIYHCNFSTQENDFSILWKCKSFNKNQNNNYRFDFPPYLNVQNTNLSYLEIKSSNFSLYKDFIDISLKRPKIVEEDTAFDLIIPFFFEFNSKFTGVQVFPNMSNSQTHNFYILSNFSSKSLHKQHFSLISYANDYNNSIRCLEKNKQCFSPFVVINMNECNLGNIFTPNNNDGSSKCSPCSQSYVLPSQANLGKCRACPTFAHCDSGIITPKEGFWRSNNFTDSIYYCSGEMNSCLGGYSSECELGYKGALCKACDVDNGYFKGMTASCGKCNGSFGLEAFFYWFEFVIFLIIEIYIVYSDSSVLIDHERNNYGEIQDKYSKKDQLSRIGNILFTYLQIVSLLEFFGIDLPKEIFSFAEFFVNPNNGILYSQYCLASYLNFDMPLVYVNLVIYVFGSFLRLLLLVIIWNLIGKRREKKDNSHIISEERNTFVNLFPETKAAENDKSFISELNKYRSVNYTYLSFIGWFLIEDIMILREVFLMFCFKIDNKKYITKDFNYQCDSEYYNIYLPYMIYPIIFLYGAIIPLYLYGSVAWKRKSLKKDEVMNKFGPLYLAVKPKYYYWPFVNYMLKYAIIIIGVFNFVDPVKIVALLMVLIGYSGLIYFLQPYLFHNLNRLEIIACWIFVVTLTFSQTQILSNIYVQLNYLNYEQQDFHWISSLGYFVILILNFGFVGFLIFKIAFLISHRVRKYLIRIKRYFSR